MRRMIPQKLIDFINKVKAKLGFNASGDLEVDDLHVGGDLEVTGAINGQENPSVKPIYCHPILIIDTESSTRSVNIAIFIFNNDATPYTTWTQVKSFIQGVATAINDYARFPSTGAFLSSSTGYIATHIYCNPLTGTIYIEGTECGNTGSINQLAIDSLDLTVLDGVNKLN